MIEDIKRLLKDTGGVGLELNNEELVNIDKVKGKQYKAQMKDIIIEGNIDEVVDKIVEHINNEQLVVKKIY